MPYCTTQFMVIIHISSFPLVQIAIHGLKYYYCLLLCFEQIRYAIVAWHGNSWLSFWVWILKLCLPGTLTKSTSCTSYTSTCTKPQTLYSHDGSTKSEVWSPYKSPISLHLCSSNAFFIVSIIQVNHRFILFYYHG